MKYILYARKSTESDDRQAMSIESQEIELLKMAGSLGFRIDKTYKESMSAKQVGRPIFDEMLRYIGQKKDCIVFAWKVDRLTRNIFDGAKIIELLEKGNIREIRTIDKIIVDNPIDKFMLSIDFGVGKKYSDDLSVNVKRGNKTKLEKGGWPGVAPIGYLNDKLDKTIIIDEERAPYIREAFDLYATGAYSVMEIATILYESGLRTRAGRKVHKSKIHKILTNPFYTGLMLRQGKLYQGCHEPEVSHQAFEKVQDVLFRRIPTKRKTLFFPFRGYLKCGVCGCAHTASRKKGHDYYYCTNGRGLCGEHTSYMRAEDVAAIVATQLGEIRFDEELIESAYLANKEKGERTEIYQETSRETILKGLEFISKKESKLLDSHLSDLITTEVYEAKMKELHNERETLHSQLRKIGQKTREGLSTLEQIKEVFLTASKAKKDFLDAEDEQKSKVLEKVLWNLEIKEKVMASASFKMPYEALKKSPKNGDFSQMLGRKGSNLRMGASKAPALPLGYSPRV